MNTDELEGAPDSDGKCVSVADRIAEADGNTDTDWIPDSDKIVVGDERGESDANILGEGTSDIEGLPDTEIELVEE